MKGWIFEVLTRVKQVIPILLFLGVRYRKLYCMNTFKLISF